MCAPTSGPWRASPTMLTGSNPFFADDLDAAEEAIEEAELVLPSLCWDELDAEADEVMFAASTPTWTSATRMSPPLRPRCPYRATPRRASGCSPTS